MGVNSHRCTRATRTAWILINENLGLDKLQTHPVLLLLVQAGDQFANLIALGLGEGRVAPSLLLFECWCFQYVHVTQRNISFLT